MDTGPYLKAAVICSEAIEGKDGALSLIRIIDRLTISASGPNPPTEMPIVKQRLKIVLMFISGRAKGSEDARIRMERPDGRTQDVWAGTLFFEGEDRGANVIMDTEVEFRQQGLYWFDLYMGTTRLTRMPFRLIYQRAGAGPG